MKQKSGITWTWENDSSKIQNFQYLCHLDGCLQDKAIFDQADFPGEIKSAEIRRRALRIWSERPASGLSLCSQGCVPLWLGFQGLKVAQRINISNIYMDLGTSRICIAGSLISVTLWSSQQSNIITFKSGHITGHCTTPSITGMILINQNGMRGSVRSWSSSKPLIC